MNDEELARWFEANKTRLETAYLAAEDPWQQSGSSIGKKTTVDEWTAKRRCIADCKDQPNVGMDIDRYLERLGFVVAEIRQAFWDGREKTRVAVIRKPLER